MVFRYYILTILLLLLTSLSYPGPANSVIPELHPVDDIYSLLTDSGVQSEALSLAIAGQQALIEKGLVTRPDLLTIIDFTKPSNENRFFVIDLHSSTILYKTLVAHGRNSGELYANRFSNRPQSHESALGFYITGSPYRGGQGYSLLLNGVDTGFNDNARERAIVIHGADYVTTRYIERYGRLGRSFGCPALPPDVNASVIDLIRDGSVVFAYYPDKDYLKRSSILQEQGGDNSRE